MVGWIVVGWIVVGWIVVELVVIGWIVVLWIVAGWMMDCRRGFFCVCINDLWISELIVNGFVWKKMKKD